MNRVFLITFLIYPAIITIITMLSGGFELMCIYLFMICAALSSIQLLPWLILSYVLTKHFKMNKAIRFFIPWISCMIVTFTGIQILYADPDFGMPIFMLCTVSCALALWYYQILLSRQEKKDQTKSLQQSGDLKSMPPPKTSNDISN